MNFINNFFIHFFLLSVTCLFVSCQVIFITLSCSNCFEMHDVTSEVDIEKREHRVISKKENTDMLQ